MFVALPQSLLSMVERHGCFTGTYSSQYTVQISLNPTTAPVPMLYVSCEDCLGFKVGALQSVLPPGTTVYSLADQLTAHMRKVRQYRMSIGGYHTSGGGFWLGAAYYDCGLFLLDGSRNPGHTRDLDLLMLAFKHRVLPMADPRMSDPKQYASLTVYLDFSMPIPTVHRKQDLLSSPQCSPSPRAGFRRATLAEFLPLTGSPVIGPPTLPSLPQMPLPHTPQLGTNPPPPMPPPPPPPMPRASPTIAPVLSSPPKTGNICPVCGEEVRERELFSSTFIGCLC